jgi:excisionase family DNA binding protein
MQNALTLDAVIDALGERVAAKVLAGLAQRGTAAAVNPRLLTVEHAAVYLDRSKEAVQHLIAEAKLPVVRTDRRVFLDVRDLDRWIEENKT